MVHVFRVVEAAMTSQNMRVVATFEASRLRVQTAMRFPCLPNARVDVNWCYEPLTWLAEEKT